jgi:hypothetical protein
VLVGAWAQTHLLDLGDVLVLLRVTCALVLLEAEFSQVGDATHWWIRRGGHFDQVEACLFCTSQRFIELEDADLLAILVDDADLDGADLSVGARTGRYRWARIKWTSGNGLVLGECAACLLFLGALVLHRWFGRGLGRLVATLLGHFRFLRFGYVDLPFVGLCGASTDSAFTAASARLAAAVASVWPTMLSITP